ncbi:MAG: hypothetical protein WD231_01445 [Candidatus Woykebacteria bacterium]
MPLFVITIFIFNLQAVVLNKEAMKDSIERVGFYEKITRFAIADLVESGAKISLISEDDLTSLVDKTFPPETLKTEVEKTIDGSYPYLLSEKDNMNLEYNLREYKNTFLTEAKKMLLKKIESLPKCTNNQFKNLQEESQEGIPECRPAQTSPKALLNEITNGDFDNLLDELPDQLILTEKEVITRPEPNKIQSDKTPGEVLTDIRKPLSKLPIALNAGFGALVALLSLIVLIKWGSFRSAVRWIGWSLLISSTLLIIVSLTFYLLSGYASSLVGTLGQSANLLVNLLNVIAQKVVFSRIIPQSIVIVIISLSLIIIPSRINPKKELQLPT